MMGQDTSVNGCETFLTVSIEAEMLLFSHVTFILHLLLLLLLLLFLLVLLLLRRSRSGVLPGQVGLPGELPEGEARGAREVHA